MFKLESFNANMIVVTSDEEMAFVLNSLPEIGDGTMVVYDIIDLGYTGNKRINLSRCGYCYKDNYYALQKFKENEFKKFKKEHKDPIAKKQKRIDNLRNRLAALDKQRQTIIDELARLES